MRISDWSSDVCSSDLVRFSVTYPEPSHELDTTIFSLEDMTGRLRMEAQLRQLEADFSHAARISMLGELTSSIAHEVNQPLAAIMTNAETSLRWLARPVPDFAKVRQLTERIAGSAQRRSSELQSLMRISYAVFCLEKQKHYEEKCTNSR